MKKYFRYLYSPLGLGFCALLVLIAALIEGLVRQESDPFNPDWLARAGLRSFKDSAFMISAFLLLLLSGALFCVNRWLKHPKSVSNFIFTGIFISVLSLWAGGYTLQREDMTLFKGGKKIHNDYAAQLLDFRIDYHTPQLYVVNTKTGFPLPYKKPQVLNVKGKGQEKLMVNRWKVEVIDYIPVAGVREDSVRGFMCEPFSGQGWTPAVEVAVFDRQNGNVYRQWLCHGNAFQIPLFLRLDDTVALCMAQPKVKNYNAEMAFIPRPGLKAEIKIDSIKPNHAVKAGGERVYLKSYKEEYGFWDPYVKFEWIKDPWAPVTYCGFALILAGILAHIILLPRRRTWQAVVSYIFCAALVIIGLINPLSYKKFLMPILNSPWYSAHVFAYIFGYTALGIAFVLSVYALFKRANPQGTKLISVIDKLTHIGTGFLLTGICLGALWAKQSWGYFWTWDPKETWALITLLCYTLYICMRRCAQDIPTLAGKAALSWQIIGFVCLQICWYGINYLKAAQGLSVHVY